MHESKNYWSPEMVSSKEKPARKTGGGKIEKDCPDSGAAIKPPRMTT